MNRGTILPRLPFIGQLQHVVATDKQLHTSTRDLKLAPLHGGHIQGGDKCIRKQPSTDSEESLILDDNSDKRGKSRTALSWVNRRDNAGWTSLMANAKNNCLSQVLYLISIGADVNMENNGGETALHMAAAKGNLQVVNCLLENNARLDMVNMRYQTALHLACKHHHFDVALVLVRRGASLFLNDKMQHYPFEYLVSRTLKDRLLAEGQVFDRWRQKRGLVMLFYETGIVDTNMPLYASRCGARDTDTGAFDQSRCSRALLNIDVAMCILKCI